MLLSHVAARIFKWHSFIPLFVFHEDCSIEEKVVVQVPLPSPLKPIVKSGKKKGTEWTAFPLWSGADQYNAVGYKQCLTDVGIMVKKLKLKCRARTHIYRGVGARRIDDAGAEEACAHSPACGSWCFTCTKIMSAAK